MRSTVNSITDTDAPTGLLVARFKRPRYIHVHANRMLSVHSAVDIRVSFISVNLEPVVKSTQPEVKNE